MHELGNPEKTEIKLKTLIFTLAKLSPSMYLEKQHF